MKIREFLSLYEQDAITNTALEYISQADKGLHIQLKGLSGSLDAVVATLACRSHPGIHLFILQNREEAAYFMQDIETLTEKQGPEILLFPASFKKPYQVQEVDNANVLQRAETLSAINAMTGARNQGKAMAGAMVFTYPEALAERVVNKKFLTENTTTLRVGDKVDVAFLGELLAEYDFERTDFVYEPGQYAIRGGIIDVYSFSSEWPYRIELFGDEVESIRSFNPETQLSQDQRQALSLVPNVQRKVTVEERDSFMNFLPQDSCIWIKDWALTAEVIDKTFEKAEESFQDLVKDGPQIVNSPGELFEKADGFKKTLADRRVVEFGFRLSQKKNIRVEFSSRPQPSFNKNFDLLAKALGRFQSQHITNIIASDVPRQLERLQTIFEELDRTLRFQPLYAGLREGFEDDNMKLVCYTDHQIFERFHRARQRERFSKSKALTLKELKTLKAGDYVVHIDYGVGRFVGLETMEANGRQQEGIRLIYRDDDSLIVSIHQLHKISRYAGKEGTPPPISKLGSEEWENKKARVKKKVKDIARDLINLYARRRQATGFAYSRDTYLQAELESSFMYEDTPDQAKATQDAKTDMEKSYPMDRLVCGDVGFGKTEVAIRAAFKAATDGKQVAVLVPTTILAMQHHKTFRDRLKDFPITVDYVNRFKSTAQVKETLRKLEEGKIDIIIGTHRLVSKDIKFKNLGLMIIDEEQKFGVKTKDRLKEMRVNVDVLTLTATPIPRTLQFSLMGARDLSIIQTPPPNRQPVTTEVHLYDESFIRDAVRAELQRGGQVFLVHNRINDIEEMGNMVLRLVPDAKVGVAHGQMDGDRLENTMLKFMEGEYDVLVSTNIIESGLDIPNANTIIINRAHMFGLSDLHQMRGRVGRSNAKAYCYLLTPPVSTLPTDARKRLQTLEEFSDLGDGFKVAMRDLDIRGAGDLLGAEQSGFITDLGFDAYHKMLDEAVAELKDDEFKQLFATEAMKDAAKKAMHIKDTLIETDQDAIIPDKYVANISERLGLYSQLDAARKETDLEVFKKEITDRFGPMPEQVENLLKSVRLRWAAGRLGFEKLTYKDSNLKGYFPTQTQKDGKPTQNDYFQSDAFGQILQYVQQHPAHTRLRESGKRLILTIQQAGTLDEAIALLTSLAPQEDLALEDSQPMAG